MVPWWSLSSHLYSACYDQDFLYIVKRMMMELHIPTIIIILCLTIKHCMPLHGQLDNITIAIMTLSIHVHVEEYVTLLLS